MLAKINRFHGHQSVRRIYRQGKPVRGSLMSVHYYSDPRHAKTKAAVVVSRKVDKSAVKRNRIRRRIYEQVRLLLPDAKRTADLVFTVYKAEALNETPEKLRAEIAELLRRASIL